MPQENLQMSEAKRLEGHYPLDWNQTTINLGKRYSHILRRPTPDEVFARDAATEISVEIAADGSYSLPDPTADEDANARLYDAIVASTSGYTGDVPRMHKSAAINALYRRDVYAEDDASPFDDEITIIEEVGDEEFKIRHVFRQPSEDELRQYRRRTQSGQIKPGRHGRQVFVSKSNLKTLCEFYDRWIIRIEGVSLDGESFQAESRERFIAAVDPAIKRMAVQQLATLILDALRD